MTLCTRSDYYRAKTNIATRQLYRTSRLLSTITGVPVSPGKAIVGANAFAHEAGIHQHGVLNERLTYEIMSPESVGIFQNKMVLGKHSGKHAFQERLESMGYFLTPEKLASVFENFKKLADRKKAVTDQDIEALVVTEKIAEAEIYSLESFTVQSGTGGAHPRGQAYEMREAYEDAALGSGPIDAALKRSTGSRTPPGRLRATRSIP